MLLRPTDGGMLLDGPGGRAGNGGNGSEHRTRGRGRVPMCVGIARLGGLWVTCVQASNRSWRGRVWRVAATPCGGGRSWNVFRMPTSATGSGRYTATTIHMAKSR